MDVVTLKLAKNYTDSKVASIPSASADGWNPITTGLSYASPTTMNSVADLTSIPRCAKFRWKQGGSYKYAYIISLTASLITILAGSDYSVANTTITDAAWSISDPAAGFPAQFNFAPTISAYSGSFTTIGTVVFKFSIANQTLNFDTSIGITTNGTAAGDVESTLPVNIGGSMDPIAYGRENAVTGKMLLGKLPRVSNKLVIYNFDGSYAGGNGYVLALTGHYPI